MSASHIRLGSAVLVAVAGVGGTVLPAGSAHGAASKTVHIKGIDFSPRVLKVRPGTTVRWVFEDPNTPHNVTSRGHTKFRSSPTKQSGSYAFRFTKHGRYAYVCTVHLNMKGTIVV